MKRATIPWWPMLFLPFLAALFLGACGGGKGAGSAAAGLSAAASPPPAPPSEARAPAPSAAVRPEERRGYVVLVDGMRIVIDLADGEVRKDSLIAITRRQSLTHPVTGEPLGEIALEVGRARIVEIQPKFSVA
ncbi:MAG: hypothetical protein HY575_02905, partial [candidate division NC10 bacterium]|nr:hypothetical protein [candidate division NC10 bacterium]